MLRKFAVTDYRGFKDRLELDLTAVRSYAYSQDCIKEGLIKTALVVGKNASGKTNLGIALFDIVRVLTDKGVAMESVDPESFLNGSSDLGYATFEYEFQFGDSVIRYEYRKTSPDTIVYERFEYDGSILFVRDGNGPSDYSGMNEWDAGNLRMNMGDGSLSVLRYIVNNTVQREGSPLSFVVSFAHRMLYFRSLQENAYIGVGKGTEKLDQFLIRNGLVDDFQRFLREMADIDMDLGVVHTDGMPDRLVQRTDNKNLELQKVCSSGTEALMLFYHWRCHLNDVGFVYIDDFDAFYHYEPAEKILRMMVSAGNIQSILTSHNTSLVRNRIMRPDCCLNISNGKLRSFSDLTDRELRQGHNMEKMYRGGEFDERAEGFFTPYRPGRSFNHVVPSARDDRFRPGPVPIVACEVAQRRTGLAQHSPIARPR